MKKCPVCSLVSPETAQSCDCGYNFESGVQEHPPSPKPTGWFPVTLPSIVTGCLTGIAALILAVLFVETQWPLLAESGFAIIVLAVIVGFFWIGLYGLAWAFRLGIKRKT